MSGCPTPRAGGVALITVLLVVFLASATAVGIAVQQQTDLRRSTVLQHQTQARWYVLGAEQWALAMLQRDRSESDIDHLGEPWAQLPPALSVPGGGIGGAIEDLQGRFNLNSLVAEPPAESSIDDQALGRLEQLLDLLELDPGLAQAIADWIDPDSDPRFPDGAEDSEYLTLEPAYLAANRPFVSVSELRLLKGFEQPVYDRLRPFVCALPDSVPVNVNTASAEVIAALDPDIDLDLAHGLLADRTDQEFESIAEFRQAAGLAPGDATGDNFTVTSDYFALRATASVGDAQAILESVLHRDPDRGGRVVRRGFGAGF